MRRVTLPEFASKSSHSDRQHGSSAEPPDELFQPGHLTTEDHLPEFLPESFDLFRIVRSSKAFGEFKKGLSLSLFCLEALFNKLNEYAVGTQLAAFCHGADLSGNVRRKRDALTNTLFFGCHNTNMYQVVRSGEVGTTDFAASSS